MVKAVILLGGETKGTRFRPLALTLPKPLFPVAGKPMVYHHIEACASLPSIREVVLIGFYNENLFVDFTERVSREFNIPVRYLKEPGPLGTAGGLFLFRKELIAGAPDYLFILHCDIGCAFPLLPMLAFHKRHGCVGTILSCRVPKEKAGNFGCIVEDPGTHQVKHYAEKPTETFISNLVNCGVYCFGPQFLEAVGRVGERLKEAPCTGNLDALQRSASRDSFLNGQFTGYIQLEQDVIQELADTNQLFAYETTDFWSQIKTPGAAIELQSLYFQHYAEEHPDRLVVPQDVNVVGRVVIDPAARVDPSAKIGPNVTLGKNVRVGKGVRISNSILLDGAEARDFCYIVNSIVGWRSIIGQWSRVEGVPGDVVPLASDISGYTILGEDVSVDPEIIVRNAIVLPHKRLSRSVKREILL